MSNRVQKFLTKYGKMVMLIAIRVCIYALAIIGAVALKQFLPDGYRYIGAFVGVTTILDLLAMFFALADAWEDTKPKQ